MSNRRHFLRSSSALIALPVLGSLGFRRFASAASTGKAAPKRIVCIGTELGLHPDSFFPKAYGRDFVLPHLLQPFAPFRDRLSVFHHLDHPGLANGHNITHAWLSGVTADLAPSMPEGNITLDQRLAEAIGHETRFPSLEVGIGGQLTWTRNAVPLPPMADSKALFHHLFTDGDRSTLDTQKRLMEENRSVLDELVGETRRLEKRLDTADRGKLDHYLTSIREVEKKIQSREAWLDVPKPKVDSPVPEASLDIVQHMPATLDLIALALETDSTRAIGYSLGQAAIITNIPGVDKGYHDLSHHGMDEEKLAQLLKIERFYTENLARFVQRLADTPQADGGSLLDHTQILVGSGMSNGSSHSCRDLPTLLIGGGLSHGAHHDFPKNGKTQTPLCNLFVTMLQAAGVETDRFGTSDGNLNELLLG
jgi:hypothetical protein